jgi:excisionase family DNA binding protein
MHSTERIRGQSRMGVAKVSSTKSNDLYSREYLSPTQFLALSGLSLSTVRRLLASGLLPFVQPGGKRCRILIPRSALESLTDSAAESVNFPTVPTKENTQSNESVRSGARPRWKQQMRK